MKRITLFYALVCTIWNISAQSHKDIASVDSLATRVKRFQTFTLHLFIKGFVCQIVTGEGW